MHTKTNFKRRGLFALLATILAVVGAFALLPKPAAAEDPDTGTLVIRKVAEGSTDEFDFTVTLANATGAMASVRTGESGEGHEA